MRPLAAAALTVVLVGPLALLGGAQLAPGWSAGATPPRLDPDPLNVPVPCVGGPATPVVLPGVAAPTWVVAPAGPAEDATPGTPETAVVLIPGAGPATRDTLLPQARLLASCGVTAVTYDKPGGVVRRDFDAWAAAAADVLAATRVATGARRVGVVAWSEGGWVAARLLDEADLAVTIGAPVLSPAHQLAWQVDAPLASAPAALRRVPAAILAQPIGLGWTQDDVRPLLAASQIPVLGVWGSADHVVPVASAVDRLRAAAGDASVLVLPDGDHGLSQTDWTPAVTAWLHNPRLSTVQGVEPGQRHGVPTLPRPSWVSHPLTHLTLALGAAVAVGALVRRRTHPCHSRPLRSTP